nr:chaperone protein DnaJ isoform X2 [Tanacetum cinerariifolium]
MLDEEEKNATLGLPNQLTHAEGPQVLRITGRKIGNPRSIIGTKNHALIQIPFLFIVLGEVTLSRYTATRRTSHITLFFFEVTVVAMSYDFKRDSSQNDKDSSGDGSFMLLQFSLNQVRFNNIVW